MFLTESFKSDVVEINVFTLWNISIGPYICVNWTIKIILVFKMILTQIHTIYNYLPLSHITLFHFLILGNCTKRLVKTKYHI